MPSRSPFSRVVALALLVAGAGTARAAADPALLAAAEAQQPAVIETLKTLVAIESGSRDVPGVLKMADATEARLKALGFETRRIKATSNTGADLVVGTLAGRGTRKIMLQAHLDTVYEPGILQTQPWKQDGNKLYGPGIADDKAGIAVILHALKILGDAGWKDYAQLTVVFDPDEEISSVGSGEFISQTADRHDVVLSFEPTSAKAVAPGEPVLLGAAGIALVTMTLNGRAAHAGAAPELGRNAVVEISHQILETRDLPKGTPGATLNWTNVVSNKATNQIPELAVAKGDVRITEPGAEKKLEAALQQKVASTPKLVPDTTTTVTMQVMRPSFRAGPAGRALADKAQAIYRELGMELGVTPMVGGGTDAAFAARSGKAAVLESLGLAGHGYHARDEYVEIDSIVPRLYLTMRLLQEIGKGG